MHTTTPTAPDANFGAADLPTKTTKTSTPHDDEEAAVPASRLGKSGGAPAADPLAALAALAAADDGDGAVVVVIAGPGGTTPPPPPPFPKYGAAPAALPTPPPPLPQTYGADGLTARQFALIQVALIVGTAIEWWDYSILSAFTLIVTPLFFPPSAGAATQALSFWAVFAVGFLARPLGALLLGSVGDRWGRRPALLISLTGMAVPTVLIGALPTYAHIGPASPVLFALLRVVQGLSMGAEHTGAAVYSVELAPEGKKGVMGALPLMGATAGIVGGKAFALVLSAALTPEQMRAWGWRVPFLLTVFSFLGVYALRMRMPEPRAWEACVVVDSDDGADDDEKEEAKTAAAAVEEGGDNKTRRHSHPHHNRRHTSGIPALKLLRHCWTQVLLQTVFQAFTGVTFYACAFWLPPWLEAAGVLSPAAASGATISALVLGAAGTLLAGWVSDKCATPRRRLAACAAVLAVGTAIAVPGFLAIGASMNGGGGPGAKPASAAAGATAAMVQLALIALVATFVGFMPSLCSELYRADVRVVSLSFAQNLCMTLVGGTAPLAISALASSASALGGALAPGVYVAASGAASLLATAAMAAWAPRLFVAAPVYTGAAGQADKGRRRWRRRCWGVTEV